MKYLEMDMRGSGIYSSAEEIAIDPCAVCDTHDGWDCVNDWGIRSIECVNGHEQPEPEDDRDMDPDWGPDSWLDDRDEW